MTNELQRDEDLSTLFSAVCDERATDDDIGRLDREIRENAETKSAYLQWVRLHVELRFREQADRGLRQFMDGVSVSGEQETLDQSSSAAIAPSARSKSWLNRASRRPIPPSVAVAVIAVAALLIGLAVTPLSRFLAGGYERTDVPANKTNAEGVATLTGTQFVDWMPGDSARGRDPRLTAGQRLAFKSGVVEITYDSGVKVLIEGPAEYQAVNTKGGKLDQGRLFLRADGDISKGFVVETPWAAIEDLGTEFCIDVMRNGRTNVLVTDGRVSVASQPPADSETPSSQEILVAGGAVRVDPGAELKVLAKNANADRFVRLRRLSAKPLGSEPPDKPAGRNLSLWLAADKGVEADGKGRVSVWHDARGVNDKHPAVGRSPSDNRRPLVIRSAIAGKPGIQFEGQQFLDLPAPKELGMVDSGYEIFIVAQSKSPKTQFLLAGDHLNFEFHLNHYSYDVGAQFIATPQEHRELGGNGELTDGRPHIFSARVEQDRGYRGVVRVDGVDGRDIPSNDARSDASGVLRLGIRTGGGFPFDGEIAEVLVYGRALSRTERQHVEAYLASKYDVKKRPRHLR